MSIVRKKRQWHQCTRGKRQLKTSRHIVHYDSSFKSEGTPRGVDGISWEFKTITEVESEHVWPPESNTNTARDRYADNGNNPAPHSLGSPPMENRLTQSTQLPTKCSNYRWKLRFRKRILSISIFVVGSNPRTSPSISSSKQLVHMTTLPMEKHSLTPAILCFP